MSDRADSETDESTAARPACDALDRELIALLLEDVRATNRALAGALGVSEWVVANRLRRLREDNVLAASLVVDWRLAGHRVSGFALVRAERGAAERIAERLGKRADAQSVSRTLGSVDLIAHVLAPDLAGLRRAADAIAAMRGVAGVEMLTAVEFHRYVFERMPLPVPQWDPDDFAGSDLLPLDEIDRGLMRCLIEDGHRSNRDIARRLEVSENTIRGRLRRFDDSGLMRVIVMVDPFAFGEAAVGYMALRCTGGRRDQVAAAVAAHREVAGLISVLGAYDLVAVAVADSLQDLVRLMEKLHAIPGVESLTQFPIVGRPLHRFHLARLL